MRVLVASLVVLALALTLPITAQAKRWPRPPSWWMNSPDMVCVRTRESGNGAGGSNLYGMLDGWVEAGGAGGKTGAWRATRAEQHYRAWILWRKYGMRAWCPWDGCC